MKSSEAMIHFIYRFIIDSFLTGPLEPTSDQLPASVASWLSWLERRTGVAGSRVQTLLKSWVFQTSLRNCKNCVHNCEDHSFTWFHIRSSHMIHFIYRFIIDSFLTGPLEPTSDQLPALVASWLSWLERRTGVAGSRVQTPLKSWVFQTSVRNCKNCVHNCENHSFTWFHIRSSHMIHFIYRFIIDSFLTGPLESTSDQLPALVASWLSWLERRTGVAGSRVQTPLKSWVFQTSLRNCKNCVHNCEDHTFTWFHICSSHMIHFIYRFIIDSFLTGPLAHITQCPN